MGLSRLNVWITDTDNACKTSQLTWYVTLFHCDGSVLRHGQTTYAVMPAPFGHWSGTVPPGVYRAVATWNYRVVLPGKVIHANHFTDSGIVRVCCDKDACVTLYNPHEHRCGAIYLAAVGDMVRQGVVAEGVYATLARTIAQVQRKVGGEVPPELREEYLALEAERLGKADDRDKAG